MLQVKGIYDGKKINLLEDLFLPPNTPVQLMVWRQSDDKEAQYQRRLIEAGLLNEPRLMTERLPLFTPVQVKGKPLSQTIIEERR
jgi:hypothetical protein